MTDKKQCNWPEGTCACYAQEAEKPDYAGRVWMHCEEGLSLTRASMARFVMFCLKNNVEIGSISPFNPRYKRSLVLATVRIHPDLIDSFTEQTGGKLRSPPRISLNTSDPSALSENAK